MPKHRKPDPNDVDEIEATFDPILGMTVSRVVPRKTPVPEKPSRSSKKNRRSR